MSWPDRKTGQNREVLCRVCLKGRMQPGCRFLRQIPAYLDSLNEGNHRQKTNPVCRLMYWGESVPGGRQRWLAVPRLFGSIAEKPKAAD